MAASWITVVAPYLPEIIRLARPMFTRKPPVLADNTPQRLDVVDAQIGELQAAATQNADAIKLLATDMQQTLDTLQQNALRLERRLRRAHRITVAAATLAILGIALATAAMWR